MAKPLLKIQRYFRRKPVRFFSLILLYLTAGSLVFLHSGFIGDSGPGARGGHNSLVASASADARGLGIMSRVFKETRRSGRRYGPPWMKKSVETERRGGDYTSNWNRALKGRNAKDMDEGRGGLNRIFEMYCSSAVVESHPTYTHNSNFNMNWPTVKHKILFYCPQTSHSEKEQ